MWRSSWLALLLACAPATGAAAEDCAKTARDLEARIAFANESADVDGAFRMLYTGAHDALTRCDGSEPLAYLTARLAELGYAQDPRAQVISKESKQTADTAAARHPASVRLATVKARMDGGVETARHAWEMDKSYVPARLALALALSNAGDPRKALELLPEGRKTTLSERIVRARVLLAAGRNTEAAAAMSPRNRSNPAPEVELLPRNDLERDAEEVLGLALAAGGRTAEARRHFETAARLGSTRAAEALARRP